MAVLALWASVVGSGTTQAAAPDWRAKVATRVLLETAGGERASFLVVLSSRADLRAASTLPTKLDKGRFVFETLQAHATRTQSSVRRLLDRLGVRYRIP